MATTAPTLLQSASYVSPGGGTQASTPFTLSNSITNTSIAYLWASVASTTNVANTGGWSAVATLNTDISGYTAVLWKKSLSTSDRGATIGVTIGDGANQRMAVGLIVLDGVGSTQEYPASAVQANGTVFSISNQNMPANVAVLGLASMRYLADASTPTGTVDSGFTEDVDNTTTATTGVKYGVYAAHYFTSSAGATPNATVTATLSGRFTPFVIFAYPAGQPPVITAPVALPRLTRNGANLQASGNNIRLSGPNIYWLGLNDNLRNSGVATMPDVNVVGKALDKARLMGSNAIRVHTLGINYGNAENNNPPTLMTSNGVYNETAWVHNDMVIAEAARRRLYLVIPFADRWNFYHGGAVTFARMALNNTTATLNDFYTNTTVKTAFKNYLNYWFNRVNTVNGKTYKNDTTIAVAELGNEMYDAPLAWTQEMAAYIKSIAPNVLVADPTAASGKYVTDSNVALNYNTSNQTSTPDANVDIFGGHYYPRDHWKFESDVPKVAAASRLYMVGEYDWTTTPQDGVSNSGSNATPLEWTNAIEAESRVNISFWWSLLVPEAGVHRDGYELYSTPENAEQATGAERLTSHTKRMASPTDIVRYRVGDTVISTPSVTFAGGPLSYLWTTPLNLDSTTNPTATFKVAATNVPLFNTVTLKVTDVGINKNSTVSWEYYTEAPHAFALYSGTLTGGRWMNAPAGSPSIAFNQMLSAAVGGGGQSAIDISVFDENLIAINTDTSGVRISNDGMRTSFIYVEGLDDLRGRAGDAAVWSKIVKGRLFFTGGHDDKSAPPHEGGLWVSADKANTRSPIPAFRIDGVAGPQVSFNGGNLVNSPAQGGFQSGYPRHYGASIAIDEFSLPGYTLVYAATCRTGVTRFKLDNTLLAQGKSSAVVEQVVLPGTSGYIRGVWLQQYKPNYSNDIYTKLIVSQYNVTDSSAANINNSGLRLLRFDNVNIANGSNIANPVTLSTSPYNVESMKWINVPGANPITLLTSGTKVYLSRDLWTASAPTFQDLNANASGNPENDRYWISCGASHQGNTVYINVGSANGKVNNGSSPVGYNTEWSGSFDITVATPTVTWITNSGKGDFQLNGDTGTNNRWWLADQNTPVMNSGATISAYDVSATNPAKVVRACRGNSYFHSNYGRGTVSNWSPLRPAGSADHSSVAFSYKAGSEYNMGTTTGDWPVVGQTGTFNKEPFRVILNSNRVANGCDFDPYTGEFFWGGASPSGGHSMPDNHSSVEVYSVSEADFNARTSFADYTSTGVTANGWASGVSAGFGIRGVHIAYPTGGSAGGNRAQIISTLNGQGLWYKRTGGSWTKVTSSTGGTAPFSTTGPSDADSSGRDLTRGFLYLTDRDANTVWRLPISANGAVTGNAATPIAVASMTFSPSADGVGYVAVDESTDTVWFSTQDEVYYINNASTVSAATGLGNAVAAGFATNFPGEVASGLKFKPKTGTVIVATAGFNKAGTKWNYPRNGADGPRMLEITNPKTASQWTLSKVDDWTISKLEVYSYGYPAISGLESNKDGTLLGVMQQGCGLGIIQTEGGVAF